MGHGNVMSQSVHQETQTHAFVPLEIRLPFANQPQLNSIVSETHMDHGNVVSRSVRHVTQTHAFVPLGYRSQIVLEPLPIWVSIQKGISLIKKVLPLLLLRWRPYIDGYLGRQISLNISSKVMFLKRMSS